MVIEKLHGLQATAISLNDRFTLLAKIAPPELGLRQQQQWRRNSFGFPRHQNLNYGNRLVSDQQIARRLQFQNKRAFKQRMGVPQLGLRRFGSESNLPRLRRANSVGNLSQHSVKNRVSWRQSNGNLSRSASFSNLSTATWRGFRRRGNGQRYLRGRFRGRGMFRTQYHTQQRGNTVQVARRARPLAQRRGGVTRNQQPKPKLVTKEELDLQLDQYMAGTKAALDLELDNYMKNAMEME